MSGKAPQAKASGTEERYQVATQELERLRARLREEAQTARQEARAELRTRYRFAIAGLALVALLVGALIGRFGLHPREDGGAPSAEESAALRLQAQTAGAEAPTRDDIASAATPWPVRIHVSGAVEDPQVVELPVGSLVVDAIEAAGGPAADADLDALNLAAVVEDNQQIRVPRLGDPATATPASRGADEIGRPIDINRASAETLATLPYIGETKAAAIVDYRTTHGAFARIEDIQEVPGIGPAIFGHIADLITVEP